MKLGKVASMLGVLALVGAVAGAVVMPAVADTATATPEATATVAPTDTDEPSGDDASQLRLGFASVEGFDAIATVFEAVSVAEK